MHFNVFYHKLPRFTDVDLDRLREIYKNNTDVQSFISTYDEQDIAAISLDKNSITIWNISPPSLQKLKKDLSSNVTINIRYSISISRITHDQTFDVMEANQFYYLNGNTSAKQDLLSILNEDDQNRRIRLPFLFPKFLKVISE